MFYYIIKWFVIYFILILLLHYLYKFIENNFTSTNIKDYVNNSKYELDNINKILNNNNNNIDNNIDNIDNIDNNIQISSTPISDINISDNYDNFDNINQNNSMENELESFIKQLI